MPKSIKLDFYCGCYKTPTGFFEEPVECTFSGTIEADSFEYQDGIVSMKCPCCGNELHQSMGHFKEVK